MKGHVWLTFDLGVRGDYESLYLWLDKHKAKECGDNVAFFYFEYKRDLPKELKKEIGDAVEVTPKARVYVIYVNREGRTTGRFLYGARKTPPWAGFAGGSEGPDVADS